MDSEWSSVIVTSIVACLMLSVSACANDISFVSIKYDGYTIPKGLEIGIEDMDSKFKIMQSDHNFHTGSVKPGYTFTLTLIKNGEKIKSLGSFTAVNSELTITCNKTLTECVSK